MVNLARGMPLPSQPRGPEDAGAAAGAGACRALSHPSLPTLLPSLGLTLLIFYYSFAIVGMEFFCGIDLLFLGYSLNPHASWMPVFSALPMMALLEY